MGGLVTASAKARPGTRPGTRPRFRRLRPPSDRPARTVASATVPKPPRAVKYARELRALPALVGTAWRLGGLGAVALELRRRTLDRVVRLWRYHIYEGDIAESPAVAAPDGITIRPYERDDPSAFAHVTDARMRARYAAARASGRLCLAAWRGERPVGHIWAASSANIGIELYPLSLPDDCFYAQLLYVAPEERGRGIGSALQRAVVRAARERGFRRGWAIIESTNLASLFALRRSMNVGLSARLVGTATFFRLAGRLWGRFAPEPGETITLPGLDA